MSVRSEQRGRTISRGGITLLAVCALSLFQACRLPEESGSMGKSPQARLELTSALRQLPSSEPMKLKLQLRNTGARDLWVNGRLLFSSVHDPAPLKEVWLDVVGPDGKALPYWCKVNSRPPEPDDYVVLKPGNSVEDELNLSKCFKVREPGVYRITAHYRDGNDHVPRGPSGTSHLSEELQSETVEVEVLAR